MIVSRVCAVCKEPKEPIDLGTGSACCPVCGSADRLITVEDEARINAYEAVTIKKRRGPKKPYEEVRAGYDLFRKTGEWRLLHRVIDREHNRYYEHIEDDARNVIRHCEEPLTEHQGHGLAKREESDPSED